MGKAVIATMTFYKSMTEVRVPLTLRTAEEARKHGYPLVVVDGGSLDEFLQAMRDRGARIHAQTAPGQGPAHQQLFKAAAETAGEGRVVDWIEAEKWRLVAEISKANDLVLNGEADLVIPARTKEAWASYPPEQTHQEKFCNIAAYRITGLDLDWFWGPFAANRAAIQYFIDYQNDYGSNWDARVIPRLRILAAGLKVAGVTVDYLHDPTQTAAESGVLEPYIKRRWEQTRTQLPAMYAEAKKLGLLR